jgi:asparagine synthase (glutamine-hydrolysing)
MCGIAGFWTARTDRGPGDLESDAGRMIAPLFHRGPDAGAVLADQDVGLAFGHRRLAIVDLTEAGAQPMTSASGRYWIVLNGEIYNHGELRTELERLGRAPAFRGTSDTEVLLAAIEAWGLVATLQRVRGMFALALWDRQTRELHLARDRFGEKPLYYGRVGRTFLFGSELKALRQHPDWQGEIDRDALALYFRGGYIPAPRSIWKGIQKLRPGHVLSLTSPEAEPILQVYWSAGEEILRAQQEPFEGDDREVADTLERLLEAAVREQMVADVPLGAFLSGGIDSSTIVALMQRSSSRPVKTFTIGFENPEFNEADHAREVARHLGTDHTEWILSARDALDVVPQLGAIYDEPFADSSQIPTILVSRLARRHVTVSLSGDAGDELFGGYTRYDIAQDLWRRISWCPATIRHFMAPFFPVRQGHILRQPDLRNLYLALLRHWREEDLVLGANRQISTDMDPGNWLSLDHLRHDMMYLDTVTYLPDDILVKVDRAAMSTSLESRVPLLDPRVFRFAWTLPPERRFHSGRGKLPLRHVLDRHVPRSLVERPKRGFAVPMTDWLRGPLRDWGEALLASERLQQQGFLDPALVRERWQAHVSGREADPYLLWDVLMFQAWLEAQS